METLATTPEAPAVESASIDDKLAKMFGLSEEPEPPAEQEAPAATPDDPDALSPEDVPADDLPSDDEVELNYNGQKRRVPKDEAVKLAQQGFDYTQKTQALAEERRALEAQKQALQARAQATPQLIKAAAVIESLQSQLQPYQNVDWVQLAQNDPAAYTQHHANMQQLQAKLQAAFQNYQQVDSQTQALDHQMTEQDAQAARRRMLDKVPAWQDPEKFARDRERLWKHLQEREFDDGRLKQYLWDPEFLAMAREAMLYREALSNRAQAKNKLQAAPAVKPGAAPARTTPAQEKAEVIKQLRQAKDPGKKKALLDEALARKFNLK